MPLYSHIATNRAYYGYSTPNTARTIDKEAAEGRGQVCMY